jgi:protoporphyrinogen oxidase
MLVGHPARQERRAPHVGRYESFRRIERHGGQVHLGRRVVGLRHDGRSVREVTVSNGRQEQPVAADAFVSSVPLTELVGLIQPAAATAAREAAQALAYRAVITVHLMLNRPRVSADTWTYVHDPRVSFARLHEPRNWSPALAPNGYTSLVLELFCDPGDLAWERNDDELVAQVSRELVDPLRLLEPGEVRGGFVVRSRDAYPRYGIGYRERVETIKAELGAFGNLLIVGRGGAFRYINTDHAIETGLLAARRLLGEAVDPDAVNRDPEYLETRRVRTNGYASDSDHQHALTARG